MRRPALGLLLSVLLPVACLPTRVAAREWRTQTYVVSARLEADAETLAFPGRRNQTLVLPGDVPVGEVCVSTSASAEADRGRTRVRVVISRVGDTGEDPTIQHLEFEWRESDPPLNASRCLPAVPLLAGDAVEFRFRFFDMPPLRLLRRGRRISTLPVLTVTGWVRHDPFTG